MSRPPSEPRMFSIGLTSCRVAPGVTTIVRDREFFDVGRPALSARLGMMPSGSFGSFL